MDQSRKEFEFLWIFIKWKYKVKFNKKIETSINSNLNRLNICWTIQEKNEEIVIKYRAKYLIMQWFTTDIDAAFRSWANDDLLVVAVGKLPLCSTKS